jgi:DNA-binding LacI/PurR family transcriptional regulator/nitrogen-specific signal transduction histidine kinase
MMDKSRRARPQQGRPTIGLLTSSEISGGYGALLWTGVADVAQERDANLLCFAGKPLRSPYGFDVQHNVIYDLASMENVDGLAILSGAISAFIRPEEIRGFCEHYRPLPMVSTALALEGIPSILVDNEKGMRDAMIHLVEIHSYRRIAFIRGPEGHQEAEARYRAYTDVLAEHGLPLDPDLVAPGDFNPRTGADAIRLLLDERKVDFEAAVAANDDMALGALQALQARGIHVPGDMAVVGFDDIEESAYTTCPLTTVRQPLYKQGRLAAETLLALLAGEEAPRQVMLSTELIVRQSCGCFSQAVLQAPVEEVAATDEGETIEAAFAARRERILSDVAQALGTTAVGFDPAWAEQLLDALVAELGAGSPAAFLSTLNEVLHQTAAAGGDVASWQGALSALRRHTLSHLGDDEVLFRAENLWQQARVLIGEMARRVQAHQRLQDKQWTQSLREIGQALTTTVGMTELAEVVAQELPRVGIQSYYLSLYENPQAPAEWSRLMLAYDEGGRIELETGGRRFPSRQLVPAGLLPRDRRYSMVVEPLYFREEQLGFVLFEMGPRRGALYETLRGHISSALRGALLFRQVVGRDKERERLLADLESRARQLQTAAEVSRAAGSTLDPDELIQQVVDLARERFDLYYAGLFLVDRTGKWAMLRAGTGEAGQKMLEQGHKLKISETSMIGWCIANRQARIALDVGEEAVRFDNPWLPETRSELALPLISRGEAIGALTIQSAQESAFSEEDITVLQTMADQLANAIANAQLYERAQREIAERKQAEEALARQAQALDAELEQFFYVASHHLQEPLRMVTSYTQFLERRYKGQLDSDADEFIAYAVEGATRIKALIDDVLALSRVTTHARPFAPTDSANALSLALADLKVAIDESNAVVTHDVALPTVMADETQLTRLFQNLIGNAIKFCKQGTWPEIHIGVEHLPPLVAGESTLSGTEGSRSGGEWVFSVHDNGIGIEPQYFDRIFLIFQRLHNRPEYPGTGIGLAICKKIVERHGGRIWVESEPDQGSTFYFTIPDRVGSAS